MGGVKRRLVKPRRGCEWEGDLAKLEKHLNENPSERTKVDGCLYVKIKCKFSHVIRKMTFLVAQSMDELGLTTL